MVFVACYYDMHWWIRLLEDINREKKDCKTKFMHPHSQAASFCWTEWITSAGYLLTNLFAKLRHQNIQNKNSGHHEDYNTTKSLDYEAVKVSFGFLKCLEEYVYHPICVKLLPEIGIFYYFSQLDIS